MNIRLVGAIMIRTTRNGKVLFGAKWPSYTLWRRFSYPATLPVDDSKMQRLRKKVPIVERRAMVKSFVNRYREAHAGKFPSSSETLKQVGGSYYVIRKILQELEHESKTSSMEGKKEILKVKELTDDAERSTNSAHYDQQTVSLFDSKVGYGPKYSAEKERLQATQELPQKTLESHRSFVANEKGLPGCVRKNTSILHRQVEEVEGSHLDLSAEDSHLKENILVGKQSEDRQYKTGAKDAVKESSASEEVIDFDIRFHKEESSKTDKSAWQTSDGAGQTKSSMWVSLKSITDSLFSMWKKL